ncbi:MAG: ribosomal-protein-alanine N-acetyltransferase [Candidatus Hydrogenedens sp.]|nr:ribosomal-protein-alanine N-acetyltransferase [Candidatus Hydrogenedens sp.]
MSVSEDRAISFQRICRDHTPVLLEIEQEAYPDPWTPGMFGQEIVGPNSHFYVAERAGEIIGYAGFWLLLQEAHVTKVTVARPYRGQGLGITLMEYITGRAVELGANTMRLEVRASNTTAQRLYRSLNFVEAGVRKNYYARAGEDALVMVRDLSVV